MSTAENSTFETNTFGFNLPCHQFVIAAERTRERRLPMVDEFILRTLFVVKSISADRLARFFGFEGRDLGIAISDLQSCGFVMVEGNNISLHPSAQEMFRTSDEDAPTITHLVAHDEPRIFASHRMEWIFPIKRRRIFNPWVVVVHFVCQPLCRNQNWRTHHPLRTKIEYLAVGRCSIWPRMCL